ncbi:class D sortase [Paenibacillus piri]|uniref:Class D sortase n=1 Tax=Paenibacillus piri TaxID=2547395 RepID=A0A4R5KXL6_9BACL|nr:class D sortase [Paenibacillus piri]TDG00567.1 class D sortase [Paenibacillus piri]
MRKFAIPLILAGLAILLFPTIHLWAKDLQQERLLRSLDRTAASSAAASPSADDELKRLLVQASTIRSQSPEAAETPEAARTEKPKPASTAGTGALGTIKIDIIKLKLPFVEGVSVDNLKDAPGHIPGTSLPGEIGNAVIAGHRSYSYGRMFNRLEELEPGDDITVESGGKTYDYVIYEKKLVEPTDLSVLNRNDTDRILTLITCDEEGVQRLILHAQLKQKA